MSARWRVVLLRVVSITREPLRSAKEGCLARWRHLHAELISIPRFCAAVYRRDLTTIGTSVHLLGEAGYSPHHIWMLARQADPILNETTWYDLLDEALVACGRLY